MSKSTYVTRVPKGSEADGEAWLRAMVREHEDIIESGADFFEAVRMHREGAAPDAPLAAGAGVDVVPAAYEPLEAPADPDTRAHKIRFAGVLREYASVGEGHLFDLENYLRRLERGARDYTETPWMRRSRLSLISATRKEIAERRRALDYIHRRSEEVLDDLHQEGVSPYYEGPPDRRPRPQHADIPLPSFVWGPGFRYGQMMQRGRGQQPDYMGPQMRPPLYYVDPMAEEHVRRLRREIYDLGDGRRVIPRHPADRPSRPSSPWSLSLGPATPAPTPPQHITPVPSSPGPSGFPGPSAFPEEGPSRGAAAPPPQDVDRQEIELMIDGYVARRFPDDELFEDYVNYNKDGLADVVMATREQRSRENLDVRTIVDLVMDDARANYDDNVVGNIGRGANFDPRRYEDFPGDVLRKDAIWEAVNRQLQAVPDRENVQAVANYVVNTKGRRLDMGVGMMRDDGLSVSRAAEKLLTNAGTAYLVDPNAAAFQPPAQARGPPDLPAESAIDLRSPGYAALCDAIPAGHPFKAALKRAEDQLKRAERLRDRIRRDLKQARADTATSEKRLRGVNIMIQRAQDKIHQILGRIQRSGAAFGGDPADPELSIEETLYEDAMNGRGLGLDGNGEGGAPRVGYRYQDFSDVLSEEEREGEEEDGAMPAEGVFDWFRKRRGRQKAREGVGEVEAVHGKKRKALRKKEKQARREARKARREGRKERTLERRARKERKRAGRIESNLSDHLVSIGGALREGEDAERVEEHAAHALAHLFDVLGEDEGEGEGEAAAVSPVTKYVGAWIDAARPLPSGASAEEAEAAEDARDELEDYAETIGARLLEAGGDASEEMREAWRGLHEQNRRLLDELAADGDEGGDASEI